MGPITGLAEFLSMLTRRAPVIAAVLVAGIVGTLSYVTAMPRTYQASTVIQILPSVIGGGTEAQVSEAPARLRLIEQQVMSRQNVTDMIARFHLFEDRPELTSSEQLWRFRQDVRIDLIPSAGGAQSPDAGVSALMLTANAGDPAVAAALANDIANQIVTGNSEVVSRRLANLVSALDVESRRVEDEAAQVQAKIDDIRRRETDALPENLEVLQAEMTTLRGQRVATTRSIQTLERERLTLQVSEGSGSGSGTVTVADQIGRLRVELAQARRRLGENHPEVRRLETAIGELQGGGVQNLDPAVRQQIALIDEQLGSMEDERSVLDARLEAIDTAIAHIPEVAERLDALTRQMRETEIQRDAVAARVAAARLDRELVAGEHGERMVVLENAEVPDNPLSSSRRRVAVLGLAASIGAALLAGFLLELARPVLRTPRQLRHALGVSAIAAAGRVQMPADRMAGSVRLALTLLILAAGAWYSWTLVAPALAPAAA